MEEKVFSPCGGILVHTTSLSSRDRERLGAHLMPRKENNMEAVSLEIYQIKSQVDVGNIFQRNLKKYPTTIHFKWISSTLCDMNVNKAVKHI